MTKNQVQILSLIPWIDEGENILLVVNSVVHREPCQAVRLMLWQKSKERDDLNSYNSHSLW